MLKFIKCSHIFVRIKHVMAICSPHGIDLFKHYRNSVLD